MGYSSQLASITKPCDVTKFRNFFCNMKIFKTPLFPPKKPKPNPQNQTPSTKEAVDLEDAKHRQLLLKLIDILPKSSWVVIQDFISSCGVLCTQN